MSTSNHEASESGEKDTRPILIHGYQLMGDTIAFALARLMNVLAPSGMYERPIKSCRSTFEIISLDYLNQHIKSLKKIESRVVVSVGFSDQMFPFKFSHTEYVAQMNILIDTLAQKGVKDLILLVPPPHPKLTSISQHYLYEDIQNTILNTQMVTKVKVRVFDLIPYFVQKIDPQSGVFYNQGNVSRLNYTLLSTSFQMAHRDITYPHRETTSAILRDLKQFIKSGMENGLSPPSEKGSPVIQSSKQPLGSVTPIDSVVQINSSSDIDESIQSSLHQVTILATGQPSPSSSHQADTMPKLTSPRVEVINGCSTLDHWSRTPIHLPPIEPIVANINQLSTKNRSSVSGSLMYVPIQVDSYNFNALVDSGASISCISPELKNVLMKYAPQNTHNHTLQNPVKLTLAVGNAASLSEVLAIRFQVSAVATVYNYFLVIPDLSETLILGCNFLRFYKAQISFKENSITLCLESREQFPVSANQPAPVENLDPSPSTTVLEPVTISENILSLSSISDELEKIRRQITLKIEHSVDANIISFEQAQLALEKLLPLASVFGPHTGTYKWEKVQLEVNVTDRWIPKKYGYPLEYRRAVREEIRSMLQQDIIQIADTPYVHPIVIVPKKNGRIRICIDASALNKILRPIHHDTRRIEHILFEETPSGLFSSFDFSQGFLQIPLHPSTSKLLGFQVDGVTYVYLKLPFGTAVSSSVFNRIAQVAIYQGCPDAPPSRVSEEYVRSYVDDVLLSTDSFDTHLDQMVHLFYNIIKSGMTLSIEKTEIFTSSIKYLGHVLTNKYISKNLDKQAFFQKFEREHSKDGRLTLKSKRAVQQLVGFFNWFSRFIPHYAKLIEPFLELIRSTPPYHLSESHQQSYLELKRLFLLDFKLYRPHFGQPFYLYFYTSNDWMSGCLFQRQENGQIEIVTLFNSRLPDTVLNKSKEMKIYGILYLSLKRFRHLLFGQQIIVERSVGQVISQLHELTEINGMLSKWFLTINSFHIDASGSQEPAFTKVIVLLHQYSAIACELVQTEVIYPIDIVDSALHPASQDTGLSQIIMSIRGIDDSLSAILKELLGNVATRQASDPFCQRIIEAINKGANNPKFSIEDGLLCRDNKFGYKVTVLPQYMLPDVIQYYHLAFCHSGVSKTTQVIKRMFYIKSLEKHVAQQLGTCISCKHNKISTRNVLVRVCPIVVTSPGEILSVDIYGPFLHKRNGVNSVFVALDLLSGYVQFVPLRSNTTKALLKALQKVLSFFSEMNVKVVSVLADNARYFTSHLWCEFLHGQDIKPKFITPYNPRSNPVERANRDLGEKLRLRINSDDHGFPDHRKWFSELTYIQETLNSTPKKHEFTPNEVLGVRQDFRNPTVDDRLPKKTPSPIPLAQRRIDRITVSTENLKNNTSQRKSPTYFHYDSQGYVHVYADGAASSAQGSSISSYSVWFGTNNPANDTKIITPACTNNQAEIMALIKALEISHYNRIERIVVHTDSMYVVDLVNEGLLSEDNVKRSTYSNIEWLDILSQALGLFESGHLQVRHVHGHTIDFGNLECDYFANAIIREYRAWTSIISAVESGPQLIQKYVATFKKLKAERDVHEDAVTSKVNREFEIGDIVAVKNHALSQAGYGLVKKFFPKYTGQFQIIGVFGNNAFSLRNLDIPQQEIVANVRQLILIRRGLTFAKTD